MTGSIDIYPKPQSCISPLKILDFSQIMFSQRKCMVSYCHFKAKLFLPSEYNYLADLKFGHNFGKRKHKEQ